MRGSHRACAQTVEEIFAEWLDDLITHHGERQVKDILGSPAVQAMFLGDVHQSLIQEGDQEEDG